MKIVIIITALFFSNISFANTELETCNGSYLIGGKSQSASLVKLVLEAGNQTELFNAKVTTRSSGSYFASIALGSKTDERKMMDILLELDSIEGVFVECNGSLTLID